MRGATPRLRSTTPSINFNPRSRAGSDVKSALRLTPDIYFNPRSPCGERPSAADWTSPSDAFQSTLPVRGATAAAYAGRDTGTISIHAPRAGSDGSVSGDNIVGIHFNPRSPCGERPVSPMETRLDTIFQSTLPVRGGDMILYKKSWIVMISIHAPRAGSDIFHNIFANIIFHFNPRSPCGERPATSTKSLFIPISIHAPRAGSDILWRMAYLRPAYFNPRSPCGERLQIEGEHLH